MTRRTVLSLIPLSLGAMSTSAPPFLLTLELAGLTLRGRLANRSSSPQPYIHDLRRQPVDLRLRAEGRAPAERTDQREIQKYDPAIYPNDVATLAPGESVLLFEAPFVRESGAWTLAIGPFRWSSLAPGRYRADLRFEHKTSTVLDPRSHLQTPIPRIWTGTLRAAPVNFSLD